MLHSNNITISHTTHLQKLLDKHVREVYDIALTSLLTGAKISLALNCWTSLNNLSFMAVIGYYINDNCYYKEALLGFKPLTRSHIGKNLATILTQVFKHHLITN